MAAVDNEFDEMAEGLWGGHREDGGPRRRRQHHRCRSQPHRHFLRRTARHDGFGRILTPAARSLGIGQSHQPVCGLQIRSAPVPPDAQELLDGREDLRDPAAERFRAAGDLRAASRAPHDGDARLQRIPRHGSCQPTICCHRQEGQADGRALHLGPGSSTHFVVELVGGFEICLRGLRHQPVPCSSKV